MAVLNRWNVTTAELSVFSKLSALLGRHQSVSVDQGDDMRHILEEQVKREIGTVIQVPDSQQVGLSNRRGMPLAFFSPDDPAAKSFAQIAQALDQGI